MEGKFSEGVEVRGRWFKPCPECKGKKVLFMSEIGPERADAELMTCPVCDGKGRVMVQGWAAIAPVISKHIIDCVEEDGERTNSN